MNLSTLSDCSIGTDYAITPYLKNLLPCNENFVEYSSTSTYTTSSQDLYTYNTTSLQDLYAYDATSSLNSIITSLTWTRGDERYWNNFGEPIAPLTVQERIREIIRSRHAPSIHAGRHRKHMTPATDLREIRARQTLCRVVGEEQFRNFIRKGFVSLRGKSGRVYQIFPSSHFTHVYENGKMVEKLCVVLKGNFPPTDSVIMRYLLILNDESRFITVAHKWEASNPIQIPQIPVVESLPDIFRRLKVA